MEIFKIIFFGGTRNPYIPDGSPFKDKHTFFLLPPLLLLFPQNLAIRNYIFPLCLSEKKKINISDPIFPAKIILRSLVCDLYNKKLNNILFSLFFLGSGSCSTYLPPWPKVAAMC